MTITTTLAPAEQKAFYDERGYILHPDLLTQDELATLRAALDEVLEEALQGRAGGRRVGNVEGHRPHLVTMLAHQLVELFWPTRRGDQLVAARQHRPGQSSSTRRIRSLHA